MSIPPGFDQDSIVTSLGRMVYYTNRPEFWHRPSESGDRPTQPTLLFLHGFGGGSSAYEWSKVYPAFAREYRILAPDLIGWGRSEHPERQYQIQDYLSTLTEFIEQTCPEPVVAIASSLTAAFTIQVAVAHPEFFQSLILTTPSGLSDFGVDYTNSFFAQLVKTPFLDQILYRTGVATAAGIRGFLENRQFANPDLIYPEIVEAYQRSALEPNAEYAALSFVRGDLCFDLSRVISQLTTPTAFIWGRQTQFTGPELGKRLASLNPSAIREFIQLENVGLTPQLEVPAVTIGLIRRFMLELTGDRRYLLLNLLSIADGGKDSLLP